MDLFLVWIAISSVIMTGLIYRENNFKCLYWTVIKNGTISLTVSGLILFLSYLMLG